MRQAIGLAVAGFFFLLMSFVGVSAAAERQFSCKGQVVQEMTQAGQPQNSIDLSLALGGKRQTSIKIGDKTFAANRISDNKIQLKFATKQFTGEYFYYTGDLFLIYKSGKLARLNCLRG
jgi:hypothetical protein